MSRSIEYLHALVRSIGHVDPTGSIQRNSVWKVKLPGASALRTPLEKKAAIGRKFHDPSISVAIAHIERTIGGNRYRSGSIEMTAVVPRYAAFAEGKQEVAIGGKLVDLLERQVRQPDVVVIINTQPVRHGEQVRTPALAQHASVAIEYFNRRPGNCRQRKHIRARPFAICAVKYKNVVV